MVGCVCDGHGGKLWLDINNVVSVIVVVVVAAAVADDDNNNNNNTYVWSTEQSPYGL